MAVSWIAALTAASLASVSMSPFSMAPPPPPGATETPEPAVIPVGSTAEPPVEHVAPAPDPVPEAAAKGDPAALREYEERYVHFVDIYYVSTQSGAVVSRSMQGLIGRYDESLKGAAYYSYVGRPDYAKSYRKKNALRLGLAGGGMVLGFATLLPGVFMLSDAADPGLLCSGADEDACIAENEAKKTPGIALTVVGSIGFVVMFTGLFINPHPVKSRTEYIKLAEEYNSKLREELGLPDLADSARLGERLLGNLRFDLSGGPGGGRALVRGRF